MAEKRRILALSDYGTSGIAESLHAPLLHWHNQGHEIWHMVLGYTGISAMVDEERYPWRERFIPIIGGLDNGSRFGQKTIRGALEVSKADIVITALDVWMVQWLGVPARAPELDEETRKMLAHENRTFRHIAYFPIDGAFDGIHLPMGLDEIVAGFDYPITYSRFSRDMIWRDLHIDVPFIPISHDPKIYCKGKSKKESRKNVGLPEEGYIVAMIGTNQYRKLWGQFFEAVTPFAQAHPDVKILPWTTWDQMLIGGANIRDLYWRSGLGDQVIDPGSYPGCFKDEAMADLYRSIDVLLLITVGEGCGLPPLRARACGTPALVSDNTSNTEFCFDDFERLPASATFFDPMGSNLTRYLTDTAEVTRRLEILYADDHKNAEIRTRLVLKGYVGMEQYERDRVNPLWDKALEAAWD